ncbi:MAG: hypothetical protein GC205_07805 [Bacteroidetes bacterium]|nr:hypothetical protein [Bacteroidota bacterium]
MDLLPFIGHLLYRHNCVIVPGLGGFVSEYRSARMHPGTGEFYPPDKAIAFNPRLERNDGLLVNSLAESEGLPYASAEELVRQFSERCHQRLTRDRTLRFPGVGKLLLEEDAKLRFLPEERENFLEESYGLLVLKALPLTTGGSRIPPTPTPKEIAEEEDATPSTVPFGERWPKQTWWWAAAFVLMCFGVWQILMSGLALESTSLARWLAPRPEAVIEEGRAAILHPLIPSLKRQMATFGPTTTLLSVTPAAILPIPDSTGYAAALATRDSLALRTTWRQKNQPTAVESLSRNQPLTVAPKPGSGPVVSGEKQRLANDALVPAPTDSPAETPSKIARPEAIVNQPLLYHAEGIAPPKGYYLIVGSFPTKNEAEKRLLAVKAPVGQRAVLFAENGNYRAGMFVDVDNTVAANKLATLRKTFNQEDAWILRYAGR